MIAIICFATSEWWAQSLRPHCTHLDTVFSMSIMLVFSSMCGFNLRKKRKIAICCYCTAYRQVFEGCVKYFARISHVYPLFFCVGNVNVGLSRCGRVVFVLARVIRRGLPGKNKRKTVVTMRSPRPTELLSTCNSRFDIFARTS